KVRYCQWNGDGRVREGARGGTLLHCATMTRHHDRRATYADHASRAGTWLRAGGAACIAAASACNMLAGIEPPQNPDVADGSVASPQPAAPAGDGASIPADSGGPTDAEAGACPMTMPSANAPCSKIGLVCQYK